MILRTTLLAAELRSARTGCVFLAFALAGCASAPKAPSNELRTESEGNRKNMPLPDALVTPFATIALTNGLSHGPAIELHPVLRPDSSGVGRVLRAGSLTTSHPAGIATAPAVSTAATPLAEPTETNGVIELPFGRSEPVVRCTVLRVCVIELEPGEALADEPLSGDQERWIITRARNGRGGANALVVVKPKACDIATNLVLSTDRRIYTIDLESPPCRPRDTNPKLAFTRRIRFTYPDDSGAAYSVANNARLTISMSTGADNPVTPAPDSPPTRVSPNRDYEVVRERRGPFGLMGVKAVDFPWMPTAVEDDGAHVYITLPPTAKQHAAPVLYALEDDGSRTMLNFTLQDSVIVTDRTFRRGLFVIMNGGQEQTLTFENRAWLKRSSSGRR